MRVRHTVAAVLAGILLIQSAAVAQTAPDTRTISHEQGLAILLANLRVDTELQIDLADGRRIEGRLVEKSDADRKLVVVDGRRRQAVAFTDVVDVHVPMSAGITGGTAFGIGTTIGAGVILGFIYVWSLGRFK